MSQLPLDNLLFDVIAVMHKKSEGLAVFDKYIKDAEGDEEVKRIFEKMRDEDRQIIEQLKKHVGRLTTTSSKETAGSRA